MNKQFGNTDLITSPVIYGLSAVGGVIVGTRNAQQSRDLNKLMDIKPDDALLNTLSDASNRLKVELGKDIDMCGKGRTS